MNGPDMIKRALALAAKDETLAQVLRAHPAERFRLYALSAGDAHANLSLMPKPVDAPDAQILLGLWYWSFAFGLVWAQYTPHDDWRRLYLSPDSRELIRETLQDSLGEVEFTAIAPEDAQGSIWIRAPPCAAPDLFFRYIAGGYGSFRADPSRLRGRLMRAMCKRPSSPQSGRRTARRRCRNGSGAWSFRDRRGLRVVGLAPLDAGCAGLSRA